MWFAGFPVPVWMPTLWVMGVLGLNCPWHQALGIPLGSCFEGEEINLLPSQPWQTQVVTVLFPGYL